MSSHTLTAHSLVPYPQWSLAQANADDMVLNRLCYSLKHQMQYQFEGGRQVDPCVHLLVAHELRKIKVLGLETILVPVPRSCLTLDEDGKVHEVWPALRVCERLEALGLGKPLPVLIRSQAVAAASKAKSRNESRTTVAEHRDSLATQPEHLAKLKRNVFKKPSVVLVDDVMTMGNQMMGALQRLRADGVRLNVEAFAPFSTLYQGERTTKLWTIRWEEAAGYAQRTPA